MPIEHKRRLSGTGFDFLVDYLNSKHSELSETIPMTEMDQEYAAKNWDKVTIKEHYFREFEFNYEEKDLVPDENGKLIFFLDHSGPEWRYYRQHPADETLYRRDDTEVAMTWSTLDPVVVSNLKQIDLKELQVDRFFSVYMNKYTNRMYERYMKVANVFPGIKYDWNHLKHLSNGSKFEMEFKDEEGYYNTNWDGFWKHILQGGLNHLVDHFDREGKLFYSSGKGWISRYPFLIEGTELSPFRIRYPFMSGTERCDEIYSSSQTFKFRDRETIEYMQERFAIQIDFKTIYGFLAFMNRVFFRGHIKNLTEKTDWSEAKKRFLDSYLEIVQNAFNENKGKPEEMYKLLYFLPEEAVKELGVSNLWEIIQYSAAVGITNIGTDKEDVVLKLLSVLAGIVTPEAFLHNLQVRKIGDKPLIERLVWRLDGYNFKAFVDLIRAVWMHSKYLIPEEGNPAYNEDHGPLMLYYTSDKTLGFHHDNATIKWTNDYKNIFVKIKEINIEAIENGDTGSLFKNELYLYHPFAPIAITNAENPEFIFKDSGQLQSAFQIMPAFVLLAREESAFWSNVATAAEYATDILTVFSGTKGIIKAGRLFRAFNMGKSVLLRTKNFTYAASEIYGLVGAVEITAGVGNGLLKLTGIRDTEIGMAVSEILLYLELAALTGELSVAIRNGLKKPSKKAVDNQKQIEEFLKQSKNHEEIQEVLNFLKTTANDFVEEKLVKKIVRSHKGAKYEIAIFTKKIEWHFFDMEDFDKQFTQSMSIDKYGFVSFDFIIPKKFIDGGFKFGQKFVDETFEFFSPYIRGAKASWMEFPSYPGGSSLGFKEFWGAFGKKKNRILALKSTTFYKTMNKKGIKRVNDASVSFFQEYGDIDVIIYK